MDEEVGLWDLCSRTGMTHFPPWKVSITVHLFYLQLPNSSLLLAMFAACIGGTFQYGYNVSVINAPTKVRILLRHV